MRNVTREQEIDPDLDLDLKIERALGAMPEVRIPGDFAARVAAQAKGTRRPLPAAISVHRASVARRVMWASAALLLVAIVVLAPGAQGLRLWIAYALGLEFAALMVHLSMCELRT